MNNETFLIEENDLELAKDICKYIDNTTSRNRAMGNAFAAKLAVKYFQDAIVDVESGLHNIPKVLDEIEIADIYIKNSYIDVQVYFTESELRVPKSHFDKGLLPVAYMFIKLDESLSGGSVTGFITPESIDKTNALNGFYSVDEQDLVSFYDIEPLLIEKYIDDLPEDFDNLLFDYLDNKLENNDEFYRLLIESKEARTKLKNAAKAQEVFKYISVVDLRKDSEQVTENDLAETPEELEIEADNREDSLEINLDTSDSLLEEFVENTEILDQEDLELVSEDFDLEEDSENSENLIEMEIDEPVDLAIEEEIETFEEDLELETEEFEDLSEPEIQDSITDELEETSDEEEITINMESEDFDFSTVITPSLQAYEAYIEQAESNEDGENEEVSSEEGLLLSDELEVENEETDYEVVDEENLANVEDSTEEIEETEEVKEEFVEVLELEEDTEEEVIQEETTTEENANKVEEIYEQVYPQDEEQSEINESIDDLYQNETEIDNFVEQKPKKKNLFPVFGILTVAAALGYYGYSKFFAPENNIKKLPKPALVVLKQDIPTSATNKTEKITETVPEAEPAMPIETVENIKPIENTNEGNAVSIPAIEKSLDASILVSNLTVNWEVPAGYVSNNTARRYFTKIGKIIQLNLKTELLLSKPPITNKITLELEYNNSKNKFVIKNIKESSGEKAVDTLIEQTVRNVLDMNFKNNMSVFNNITGNPTLIIRL